MDHEVILEVIDLQKMDQLVMYFKIMDILDVLILFHLSTKHNIFIYISILIFLNFKKLYINLFLKKSNNFITQKQSK